MMGRTHATSAVAVSLAAYPLVSVAAMHFGFPPIVGWGTVVTTVTSAGGAMSNDLDHAKASAAQSLGPLTKAIARVVGFVFGGHRNGTHSLLFVTLIGFFTYWLGKISANGALPHLMGLTPGTHLFFAMGLVGRFAYGLWLAFWFAVASAAMHLEFERATIKHTVACLLAGILLVWLTSTHTIPPIYAAYGMSMGALTHILGDMLTKEGCPLLWPLFKTRFRFAELTTGKRWETFWLFWTLNIVIIVLLFIRTGMWHVVAPYAMWVPRHVVGLFS